MSNQDKVVLVTGGSSGIGAATAVEYSKLGYKVVITGRDKNRIQNVLDQLTSLSPSKNTNNFLALTANFEDPAQVDPIVEQTLNKFGQLDILVNNAGYRGEAKGLNGAGFFEDFQNIMQVNLMAATRLAQLASPHLIKTKGVIINVSSICDRLPTPSISYSVAKAGLSMLTKTLANALEGTGVRVVTVAPGPIVTNFSSNLDKYGKATSLQRAGEATEVANTIVFLASDKASYIHGCTIDIDGGLMSKFNGLFNYLVNQSQASQ